MPGYRVENLSTQRIIADYQELETPFHPSGLLPVPYISQVGVGASYSGVDCGPACTAMLMKAYRPDFNASVDVLFKRVRTDKFALTDFTALTTLLREEGLDAIRMNNLTMSQVFDILRTGRPILALINYEILNKAGLTQKKDFFGNHFVVIVGMDGDVIFTHDPYCTGDNGESVPYPLEFFETAWKTCAPARNGLVPVRSLYPEENDRYPALYRIRLTGNNKLYDGPDGNFVEYYSGGAGDQLTIYGESGRWGLVRPWPGHWIDMEGKWVEQTKIPIGAPKRILTNLETNEQKTFSNMPAGLRPLRLLPVPFEPVGSLEEQPVENASAAACGLAILQAGDGQEALTVSNLMVEMEASPAGGSTLEQLRETLTAHNIAMTLETNLNLFDLFTRLKDGKPLILSLNFSRLDADKETAEGPAEHTRFVLLIGMDNQQVCFHDPASEDGAARCLPLALFEKALVGTPGAFTALTTVQALNESADIPAGPKTAAVPVDNGATSKAGLPLRVEIRKGCSVHIRTGPSKEMPSAGILEEGEQRDILEINLEKNYGRIATDRWITLSRIYVKKI